MKNIIILLFVLFGGSILYGQEQKISGHITSATDKTPLLGVSIRIKDTPRGTTTNEQGDFSIKAASGEVLVFSFIGFRSLEYTITQTNIPLILELEEEETELEGLTITSTRSSRTIEKVPTRIELITAEELDEKGNMRPSDLRMLLSESTGIQVQTTSPISANAGIRIQGLDGRYTQILKDGFPAYSGAASGLGLLQTPPLDLKQVEVIKGTSSTLYGGGAIAGLVNLISKTPTPARELVFHIDGTSAKGLNLNAFYGQKFNHVGTTLFASHSRNQAYAPSDTPFSAIPRFERWVVNPKLFLYFDEDTSLNIGINAMVEQRLGGHIEYLRGNTDPAYHYFEENNTHRYGGQLTFDHHISEDSRFQLKSSINYFQREIVLPDYRFSGTQLSSFTEGFYGLEREKTDWIIGVTLLDHRFKEQPLTTFPLRDEQEMIVGGFAQNTWKTAPWLEIESGLRTDFVKDYGWVVLPKLASLFLLSEKLTFRISGGLGYKTPTLFTEESERLHYQNILPVSSQKNRLEKSYGANFDINYQTLLGEEWTLSINQLFFYTYLDHPLLLENLSPKKYHLTNIEGHILTKGLETNVKISYKDFKLFLGYTLTNTQFHEGDVFTDNLLTAKHRTNSILFYEVEDKWKIGLEAYYFSSQLLSDGERGHPYWMTGFIVEKLWKHCSVYINFENFLDVRQTRFGSIYTGSERAPVFKDIYAPLDGFVFNGGIKLKL